MSKKDFAPGLPVKNKISDIPEKENKTWEFVIQKHLANRAGLHYDVRLGDPSTGIGHSFVVKTPPKKIGDKILAVQTSDHRIPYFDFKGKIKSGYGAGKVSTYVRQKIKLHSSSPKKISFSLDDKSKHTLIHIDDKNWLMIKSKLKKEAAEKSTLLDKIAGNPVNKRYWQMLKRLHGGTESTMKELSKSKDFGIYHGTAKKSLDNIMKEGLTPSLAGFGKGSFLGSKDVAKGYSMNDTRALLRLKYPNELKKGENYPSINNFVTNQKNIPKNVKTYKDKNLYKTYGIQNSGDKTYATSVGVMRSKKNIPSKFIKEIPLEKPKSGEWKLGNNSVGMNKINSINKGQNLISSTIQQAKLAEDLKTAKTLADDLIKKHLRRHAYKISVVGSIARKHDQVNDIDVVMWPKKSFNEYSDFIGQSGKKVMKFDYEGMPVNLFIADKKSYEPTRYHFSRGKGIIQDKIKARQKGYKLTRYGLSKNNEVITKEKKIKDILLNK